MRISDTSFFRRYYNKLMLVNTIIVCFATLLYGVIASRNAFAYERVNQLKIYDDTLSDLFLGFQTKQNDFHNIMQTIYNDQVGFVALSNLIESPTTTLTDLNVFDRLAVNNLLQTLSEKDKDIQAVILYKHQTDSFYIYRPDARILQHFPAGESFLAGFDEQTLNRQLIGIRDLANTGYFGTFGRESFYSYFIGGNLATQKISMVQNPGKIVVAYNEISLRRFMYNRTYAFEGRFLITTYDGQIVFDSQSNYLTENLEPQYFAYTNELIQNTKQIIIDEETVYTASMMDPKRNFIASYFVPKSEVDSISNYYSSIIYIGAAIFIGISLFVLILSTHMTTKRVGELEKAMGHIGSNNLSYRIPLKKSKDELTAIAGRFNQMCDELERTINESYVYQLRQKDAELYALQTSVNPHFLYNTLEAIRYNLDVEGNGHAAEMIVLLSRLYRAQIKGSSFVLLREEMSLNKMYLELFAMRYNHHLYYRIDLPQNLCCFAIPKLTLQPILENYLIYGMKKDADGMVNVRVWQEGQDIFIQIEDNGKGINPGKLSQIQHQLDNREETSESGFGLSNVHERLRLVFGNEYGLKIENRKNESGTAVTLRIRAVTLDEIEQLYKRRNDSGKKEE